VQATYMAAFTDVSVDEVVEDFKSGEIGRYAIEEDALNGEQMVELEEIDQPYFENLVRGVHAKKQDLENALRSYLKDGSAYDHMNATMQALLLCAVYELGYTTDIDAKVIIQEYVDLAYAFFMKNEPKMINALLDQIAKNVRM
jgi:N utilization substance protein B